MQTLRSRIALILLACFMRVLVPDAWILALHEHEHTTREHAHEGLTKGKTLLSAKHQHCGVDHLYNVPFQPSAELVFVPVVAAYAPLEHATQHSVWDNTVPATRCLRGPPA
jgi:hypothetical protein